MTNAPDKVTSCVTNGALFMSTAGGSVLRPLKSMACALFNLGLAITKRH